MLFKAWKEWWRRITLKTEASSSIRGWGECLQLFQISQLVFCSRCFPDKFISFPAVPATKPDVYSYREAWSLDSEQLYTRSNPLSSSFDSVFRFLMRINPSLTAVWWQLICLAPTYITSLPHLLRQCPPPHSCFLHRPIDELVEPTASSGFNDQQHRLEDTHYLVNLILWTNTARAQGLWWDALMRKHFITGKQNRMWTLAFVCGFFWLTDGDSRAQKCK